MIVKKNVNTRNPLSFFVKVTVHIPYNSVCRCELTMISKPNTLTQCAPWCFLKPCLVYSKTHLTRQRFSQAYFKPGAQQNQVTLNEECYKYIFLIICLLCILLVSQLCSHKRFSCCTNFQKCKIKRGEVGPAMTRDGWVNVHVSVSRISVWAWSANISQSASAVRHISI